MKEGAPCGRLIGWFVGWLD